MFGLVVTTLLLFESYRGYSLYAE